MKIKKLCPICSKPMKYNLYLRRYECPKIRTGREKKIGCGYISDKQAQIKITTGDGNDIN